MQSIEDIDNIGFIFGRSNGDSLLESPSHTSAMRTLDGPKELLLACGEGEHAAERPKAWRRVFTAVERSPNLQLPDICVLARQIELGSEVDTHFRARRKRRTVVREWKRHPSPFAPRRQRNLENR